MAEKTEKEILKQYGLTIEEYYTRNDNRPDNLPNEAYQEKEFEVGSYESRLKGEGIRKFRRPTTWNIENKILYGLLFAIDMDNNERQMKVKDFADKVGVNERTAAAWIFEGRKPTTENRQKICELLGYPENIIFFDIKEGKNERSIKED